MYERLEVPLCLYCYCTRLNVASVEEKAGSYLSEVYVLSQGRVELAKHNDK